MQLRWTEAAIADLEHIADYLFEPTPLHAARIMRSIYEAPVCLTQFPLRGRSGRKDGTRELVLPSLPYVIVYTVSSELIQVIRILHGSQKWP